MTTKKITTSPSGAAAMHSHIDRGVASSNNYQELFLEALLNAGSPEVGQKNFISWVHENWACQTTVEKIKRLVLEKVLKKTGQSEVVKPFSQLTVEESLSCLKILPDMNHLEEAWVLQPPYVQNCVQYLLSGGCLFPQLLNAIGSFSILSLSDELRDPLFDFSMSGCVTSLVQLFVHQIIVARGADFKSNDLKLYALKAGKGLEIAYETYVKQLELYPSLAEGMIPLNRLVSIIYEMYRRHDSEWELHSMVGAMPCQRLLSFYNPSISRLEGGQDCDFSDSMFIRAMQGCLFMEEGILQQLEEELKGWVQLAKKAVNLDEKDRVRAKKLIAGADSLKKELVKYREECLTGLQAFKTHVSSKTLLLLEKQQQDLISSIEKIHIDLMDFLKNIRNPILDKPSVDLYVYLKMASMHLDYSEFFIVELFKRRVKVVLSMENEQLKSLADYRLLETAGHVTSVDVLAHLIAPNQRVGSVQCLQQDFDQLTLEDPTAEEEMVELDVVQSEDVLTKVKSLMLDSLLVQEDNISLFLDEINWLLIAFKEQLVKQPHHRLVNDQVFKNLIKEAQSHVLLAFQQMLYVIQMHKTNVLHLQGGDICLYTMIIDVYVAIESFMSLRNYLRTGSYESTHNLQKMLKALEGDSFQEGTLAFLKNNPVGLPAVRYPFAQRTLPQAIKRIYEDSMGNDQEKIFDSLSLFKIMIDVAFAPFQEKDVFCEFREPFEKLLTSLQGQIEIGNPRRQLKLDTRAQKLVTLKQKLGRFQALDRRMEQMIYFIHLLSEVRVFKENHIKLSDEFLRIRYSSIIEKTYEEILLFLCSLKNIQIENIHDLVEQVGSLGIILPKPVQEALKVVNLANSTHYLFNSRGHESILTHTYSLSLTELLKEARPGFIFTSKSLSHAYPDLEVHLKKYLEACEVLEQNLDKLLDMTIKETEDYIPILQQMYRRVNQAK